MAHIEIPVLGIRQLTNPDGASVSLFRIGPHAAIASQKTTIEEAALDPGVVGISLDPLYRRMNKPVRLGDRDFKIVFDNTEWNKKIIDLCNVAFETAHLEPVPEE